MTRPLRLLGWGGFVVLGGLWAWAEREAWRASLTGFPPRAMAQASASGRRVVMVLGYGNTGSRINLVNSWRVRAALRTLAGEPGERVLLCTGGRVHSTTPEAEILAGYARRRGFAGEILREDDSTSTQENIAFSAPLLRVGDRISIVSDPVHAVRARALLWRSHPELAVGLVPGREYRFGERPLAKIVGALRARFAG